VRQERPLVFFGVIAIFLALFSLGIGLPVVIEFIRTGFVTTLPSAVLAASLALLSALAAMTGLILDTVTRGRWETKRLHYLSFPPP